MFLLTYFPIHTFSGTTKITVEYILDCILQNYIHIKIDRYNNLIDRKVLVSLVQHSDLRT